MSDASDSPRAARPAAAARPSPRGRDARVATNRRASREAVEKRRAARHFNEVVLGPASARLDGRTEKKRLRMLEELTTGQLRSSGRALKPIEVLLRVQALLDLGETLPSLKKSCRTPRPLPRTGALVDSVRRLHDAYGFPIEAYAFVGIDEPILREAGLLEPKPGPASTRGRSAKSNAA